MPSSLQNKRNGSLEGLKHDQTRGFAQQATGSGATHKELSEWKHGEILWGADKQAVKGDNFRTEDGNSLHMAEQE